MRVTELDVERAGAFVERLFGAALETIDIVTVYIGDRLGLYRALAERGSLTSDGLAEACGMHPRYAREWCEQQTVVGILDVDDPAAAAEQRRYTLPNEHAAALTDPDSPFSVAPVARFVASCTKVLPELLDAYR